MDPTEISRRLFSLRVFFSAGFSGLRSDSILRKLSLSYVLLYLPHFGL